MTNAQHYLRPERPFLPSEIKRPDVGKAFCRAAFAVGRAAIDNGNPIEVAESHWPSDRLALTTIKAATAPASTTTSGWALQLAPTSTVDFVASLAPQSAAARLIGASLRVSLSGFNEILIPHRAANLPNIDATWVSELSTIPVRALTLSTTILGPVRKLASSVVLSRELANAADGESVFTQLLTEDLTASLDASMFSAAAASSSRPAGLLNGVSALTATSGGTELALRSDIAQLAAVVGATGSANIAFVASPATAVKLATYPTVIGESVQVWPSIGVSDGVLIAIAVDAFVSGFGAVPRIRVSQDAVVVMDDAAPSAIGTAGSPNIAGAPARSLYQSDSIAVRCILEAAWALRASGSVAWLTGASW